MGVFDGLISRKTSRGSIPHSVWLGIEQLMVPQLDMLGTAAGTVPIDARTGDGWSRGYVLGIGCSAVRVDSTRTQQGWEETGRGLDDRMCFDAALAAFAGIYGPSVARDMLVKTIDEASIAKTASEDAAPDGTVLDGLSIGADDAARILDGCAPERPNAFWLHNNLG